MIRTILAAVMMLTASVTYAQKPGQNSTTVNNDGTVTFRYGNPSAREVMVDVQFAGRHAMERDPQTGFWTATVGPAAPDMYPYCFIVDGVSVMDPQCNQWFPNEGFKNSLLEIDSPKGPLVHSIQPVAHGKVSYVSYYSNAIGAYNNAIIYTPPTYDEGTQNYPVFYLISGTTDTEEVYYKVGRMNHILDNLIAQGQAREMIIVLPYGNPTKLAGKHDMMGDSNVFGKDLLDDLMPYVEANYRTINDRDHRAIGGFSRGGNQALYNGLTHLDRFSYLCSYSSFTSTDIPEVYDNADKTNGLLHLFWAGVGTDDFLYGTSRDYTEFLDKKGICCVKEYTTDKFGHTWMNAKYFLDKTLRLLFNPEASAEAMRFATPTKARTGKEQQFTPGVMARLFPKPVISPDFAADGSVTLRFKAPEAHKVVVKGDLSEEPILMSRDSDGVWNAVLTDLQPAPYCYYFVVDGTPVADPQNMYLAPSQGFKHSILNMPGDDFAVNRMHLKYSPVVYSTVNDGEGKAVVEATVVPSGHENEPLPTLNLVAGNGDMAEAWIKIAHANLVIDQLLADGLCRPYRLHITEKPDSQAAKMLDSANFASWKEAREALVRALKE